MSEVGGTAPDRHRASPEAFAAWMAEEPDELAMYREANALFPYLATLPVAEEGAWRVVLAGRGKPLRATTFDRMLAEERAKRAQSGDTDAGEDEAPRPEHKVNLSGPKRWRYTTGRTVGAVTFERGVYEQTEGVWLPRATLPHVLARIVRRDGSRRRTGTEYLVSATETGPRVVVNDEDLKHGTWAGKLGVELSIDRDIIAAAGTSIKHEAHRAGEQEAVPPIDPGPGGRVTLAPAECLPDGYLKTPAGVSGEELRAAMREVVKLVAGQPGGKMALAMGASAVAPFVGPLWKGKGSFWFDLYGDSSMGKSTTTELVASLWGDPSLGTGIVLPWNASSIGSGRHLGQLGILPPFFDERGMQDWSPEQWGESIYETVQGNTRLTGERLSHDTRRSPAWFGILFSSGNHRLTDGITAGRFAGIPRRVIELSTPFTDSADVSHLLSGGPGVREPLLPRCFGWLGPQIVDSYTTGDVRELIDAAGIAVGAATEQGIPGKIAGHLHMIVAGAMMVDEQVGTGNLLADAAINAARDYLAAHDVRPEHDADRMVRTLAEELAAHPSGWPTIAEAEETRRPEYASSGEDLQPSSLPKHGIDREVDGWRSNDGEWLYVTTKTWRQLAEAHGLDSSVTCQELHGRGILHVPASLRKRGEWAAPGPRISGKRLSACYQLRWSEIEARYLDGDQEPGNEADGPQDAPESPAPAEGTRQADSGPQASAQAPEPRPAARETAAARPEIPYGRDTAKTTARQDAQAATRAATREAIDSGRPLRFLAALEGPFAPLRKGRQPYWRPEMPMPVERATVPNGISWRREYAGEVVSLDRSGAWPSAASSVEIVHGKYERTGEVEWSGKPGYYLVTRYPWHESTMPDPLGNARGETAWITAPTLALLAELVEQGRWPDVAVLDSYTGEPARLREWTTYVNEQREYAIAKYGRGEGSPYDAVKENFGMALSLMMGSHDGQRRVWKTKAQRPDWPQFIQAHATGILWRYADDMRRILPAELAPVSLRNIDEIVIPSAALDIVTTTNRPGGRKPIQIDPDGIRLGSFKAKERFTWGDDQK